MSINPLVVQVLSITLRMTAFAAIAAGNIALSTASEPTNTNRTREFFDEVEEKAEANAHYFRNLKLTLIGDDEDIKQEYWSLFTGTSQTESTASDSKNQPKELATEAHCSQERLNKLVYNTFARGRAGQLRNLSSEERKHMFDTTPVEEGILDIEDRELFWRIYRNLIRTLRVNYSQMEKNLTDPKVNKRWQGLLQRVYSELFNYANFTLGSLNYRQETLAKVRKLSEEESSYVKEITKWKGILGVAIGHADPDAFLDLCSRVDFTAPIEGLSHYPIISQASNDLFDVVDIMKRIESMLGGSVSSTVNLPAGGGQAEGTRSGDPELYGCNTEKSISEKIVAVTSKLVARHKLGLSRTTKSRKTKEELRKPQRLEELVLSDKESSETVDQITKEFFDMIKSLPGNGKQANSNQRKREKAKEKRKIAGSSAGETSSEESGHAASAPSPTAVDSPVIADATLPTSIKSASVSEPDSESGLAPALPSVSSRVLPGRALAKVPLEKKYPGSSLGKEKESEKVKPSLGKPPYKLDSFAANAYKTATRLTTQPVSAYDMERFIDQIGGKIDPKSLWKGSKRGMYIPNFSSEKTRDYLYVKLDFPHSGKDFFNTWTLRGIFGRDLQRAGIASQSFYLLP